MMLLSYLTACDYEVTNKQDKHERGGEGIRIQARSDAAISSLPIVHQRKIQRIKENRCIGRTIAYNWMVLIGYNFSGKHKASYVNSHEKEESV